MKISTRLLTIVCLWGGLVLAAGNPNDVAGSKDPALFNRMPGYHIYRFEDLQFDKFEFKVGSGKTQVVEGRHTYLIYDLDGNGQAPSPLQIGRNYINAVKAVGGQLVYEFNDPGENVVLKAAKGGAETWVYLEANGSGAYSMHVIERQGMNQDVVADADSMGKGLRESGKVALYGIYFDTAKAELKAESEASLKEIVKLLQAGPRQKLYVVGHTDNAGTFEGNLRLSKDRADAVVKALVARYAGAAGRLQPFGAGAVAPVASNLSEAGRALNRRVELVAQ